MRKLLVITLIGLLSFCPVLCGAAEVGHDAHGHGASQEPALPTHCPDEGDNCICQGALISSSDGYASSFDTIGVPLDLAELGQTLSRPFSDIIKGGPPAGPASWGDGLKVCALLQIFRC